MSQAKIDVHIHLVGTGCCKSGCFVSDEFRKRYTFKFLKWLMGIKDEEINTVIDETWAERIVTRIQKSELDYGVALGFDGVITSNKIDTDRTQMYIPNDWVYHLCEKHRELLPGPSINPLRADAVDLVEEANEKKAVLIKWLPSTQLIEPNLKDHTKFYQKLADYGIPLLVHTGGERTFKSLDPSLNDLQRLERALDQGVKVICAHSATPIIASNEESQLPLLVEMLRKHDNLWVDNSAVCSPGRFQNTLKLIETPEIHERTLYGSDWPVPSNSIYFLKKLGLKQVFHTEKIKNYFQRDLITKRQLGFSDRTLTRPNEVLANLDHWIR